MKRKIVKNLLSIVVLLSLLVSCKNDDVNSLWNTTNTLQKLTIEMDKAIKDLQAANVSLNKDLKAAQQAADDAKAAAAKAKTEAVTESLKKTIEVKNELNNNIKTETSALKAKIDIELVKLSGELEILGIQVDGLKKSITTLSEDMVEAKSNISKALAELELQKRTLELYGADIEELNEIVPKLRSEMDDVQAALKTIQEIDYPLLNELINGISSDLNVLTDAINKMVTNVTFNVSNSNDLDLNLSLTLTPALQDFQFGGEGFTGTIEFVKGQSLEVNSKDSVLVRVSPANAILNPQKMFLVNSKGEIVSDEVVEISVARFDKLLTKASINTGLWWVKVSLKTKDETVINGVIENKDSESILFALGLENTIDNSADADKRYIMSEYSLTLSTDPLPPIYLDDFTVDKVSFSNIKNNYTSELYKELKWKDDEWDPESEDTEEDVADNRSSKSFHRGEVGKSLEVDYTGDACAYYVILDSRTADDDTIKEWKKYSFSGLNQVIRVGEKLTITNTEGNIWRSEIGFRIFAVNRDGSLVDPDGKAFWVKFYNPDELY